MIVVDVETGGLDPKKSALLSIGAVELEHPDNQWYIELRPQEGKELHPRALAVNNYNPTKWQNHDFDWSMQDFVNWIKKIDDPILAGHNPSFDRDFCNQAFREAKLKFYFNHRTIDLHSIAYGYFTKQGVLFDKLYANEIYRKLNMPAEPNPHHGLNGAKWEAEAFSRMIHDKALNII